MFKKLYCFIVLLFISLHAVALDKVSLQLSWENEFQFAGYYAAKWQGFYKDQGLEVDILPGVRPNQIVINPNDAIKNGSVQFAIGTSDVLLDNDVNPILLASIFHRNPMAIFSLKKTDITTLDKLSKLRIAGVDSNFAKIQLIALFTSQGFDLSKIKFVRQPVSIDTLLNNKADAIITYQISAEFAAQEKNIQLNQLRLDNQGLKFYSDSLYTSFEYSREHPDIVEKFTNATKKGWLYALNNKQEIAKRITDELPRYLVKYDNLYEYNMAFANSIEELMHYPETPIGEIDKAQWINTNQKLRSMGLIKSPLNDSMFNFNTTTIKKQNFKQYYYLLLMAFCIPLIIFFWYRQYKKWTIGTVLIAMTLFEMQLEQIFTNEDTIIAREKAAQQLNSVSAKLQGQLQNNLSLLSGFAAYISARPNLSKQDFNHYARALFAKDTILVNFAAAKDLTVNYIYPLKGNETVIGLNYRKTPEQLKTVEQAINANGILLSDPIQLVQGGNAFIGRAPVFLEDGSLWGVISAPINSQLLYQYSGLDSDYRGFKIAIKSIDYWGQERKTFFGDAAIFESPESLQSIISAGSSSWKIATIPLQGDKLSPDIFILRTYFLICGIIFSLFIWYKFTQTDERKRLQLKLYDDKRLLDSVGYVAKIGGWKIDPNLNFLEWSKQASLAIGKSAYFRPSNYADLQSNLSLNDYQLWQDKIETALDESTPFDINLEIILQGEKSRWLRIKCDGKKDNYDNFIIGTIQDITEKVISDKLIEYQASYDSLTDLPNRRTYQLELEKSIKIAQRTNQQLAVLFIDLDRFKPINDNHGHHAGDLVLIEAATRLKQQLRETDTVSRLSGDEFAVILNNIRHPNDALLIAKEISKQMQLPYRINQFDVHLSVSIGIALYPEDAEEADSLLKKADQAMYEVKANGRNGYQYYTHEMQLKSEYHHDLLNKLIDALNKEELQPYFQPIFNLQTQQITKCETLARWQQKNGEFVSPIEFINLAEESGLINRIDLFMLHQSSKQLLQINPEINLSINVSPRLFHTKDNALKKWVNSLKTICQTINITVEITERLLTDDSEKALTILNQLKALGVKIAIDDFGTGYSSLNYLIKFPVDFIKIDQSFIKNIGIDSSSEALIETILAMAQRLNIEVVAEGIETQAQLTYLQKHKCSYGQGYFLGKPMSGSDFNTVVSKQ